jgi:PDZ domain-containing protein
MASKAPTPEHYIHPVLALLIGAVYAGLGLLLRFGGRGPLGWLPAVRLPLWALLCPVAAALTLWAVLAWRAYPRGAGKLLLGIPLLALVVSIDVVASAPELTPPPGQPAEITALPAADGRLPADVDEVVVFHDQAGQPIPLMIEFGSVTPIAGYWSSTGAQVVVDGLSQPLTAPDRPRRWGDEITKSGPDRPITPAIEVQLPLSADQEHQRVAVQARMDLTYPSGGILFQNVTEPRSRAFVLFVGSAEDAAFRQQWDTQQQAQSLEDGYRTPLLIVGLIGAAFTAVGVFGFVRDRGRGRSPYLLGDRGLVIDRVLPLSELVGKPDLPGKAIVLATPLSGSAAERAGVHAGDLLTKIDGQPFDVLAAAQFLAWGRGPKEPLVVTVARGHDMLDLTLDADRAAVV